VGDNRDIAQGLRGGHGECFRKKGNAALQQRRAPSGSGQF
jgi:hypothetical protein